MTTSKKYELIPSTKHVGFYRIRALRDIPVYNVKAGRLGGLVLCEENLSQTGTGWIDSTSKVIGNASVLDALICDNSSLYDNVKVSDGIIENSELHHDTTIFKHMKIKNSIITDCEFHQGGAISDCRLKNSIFEDEVYLSESVVDAYFGLEVSGFAIWNKTNILLLNKGWIHKKSEFTNVSIDSVSMNAEIELIMRYATIEKNKMFMIKAGDQKYSRTNILGSTSNPILYTGDVLTLIDSSIEGDYVLKGKLTLMNTELNGMGTITGNIDIFHSIVSDSPTIKMKNGKISRCSISGFSMIHQESPDNENPTIDNIYLTDDERLVC